VETVDGGETWWRDPTFNRDVKQFVTDIAVLSNNEVLVVTDGNYIYKSLVMKRLFRRILN